MAQRMEQPLPEVTPNSSKKSSLLWKRRIGKGKRYGKQQKSDNENNYSSSANNKAAASPTTVAEAAMLTTVTINNNGISKDELGDTAAVAVSSSSEKPSETPNFNHKSTYTMADDAVAYFPPSSNAAGSSSQADSAASYFNSFISGHRLSFSEDEDETNGTNGLIIQEVTQTSFVEPSEPFMDVDKGEKWTPFGTDLEPVDIGLPNSPDEAPNNNDQQRNPPQQSQPEILFENRQIEGGVNTTYHFNDGTSPPLTDPPSTHRKTLTPEFFLGSGSNNKNNTNLQQKHHKKGRKKLDASTAHNTSMASHNNTSAATSMKENNNYNNVNNLSSNISNDSSSDGGDMYAEIYLPIKPKKKPYPPPSTMMGGVSRDRSTLSSNTMPSLAITAVSSLSGRTSVFGTQSNGCCTENPMPITAEGVVEMGKNNDGGVMTYNYFDYDANAGSPLSPQGVSPERDAKAVSVRSSNRSSKSNNDNMWKIRLNNLWQSVAKHTCRCFGEPFSNEEERDKLKNQVSSATTAATSTTPANTMKGPPMFSTPIVGSWDA